MPQKSASVSLDQTARAGVVGGHRVLMPGQVGRERVWLPVKHASLALVCRALVTTCLCAPCSRLLIVTLPTQSLFFNQQ